MVRRRKRPHRKTAPEVLAKRYLGKHARIFEEEEVLRLLREAVELEGSQLAFSKRHPVDRTHLNFVLQGKRALSDKFLKLLGLRRVYTVDR